MSLAPAYASVQQPAANAKDDAHNIRDPVVYVGAAVEAGLDELDRTAEGARADEHGEQPDAACAGQWEGERGEGDEVHQLVASLRRRWRLFHWPKHRDGQGERHGECQRDVEVLAHPPGCNWGTVQRQIWAFMACIRG